MDAAMRERLLATIDAALNRGALTKIERVRLLDLWWRVATDGRGRGAQVGRSDLQFLSRAAQTVAGRTALAGAAFLLTIISMSQGGVVS
jgi:hypothetical protein